MSEERSANAIDRRLGQRVRTRRLEIGMSQERLAELLGITFQQVQKYEKGVNRIAASRLFAIAAALDMPVGQFYDGLAPKGAAAKSAGGAGPVERVLATAEGVQLITLFDEIADDRVRKRLLSLAQALADEKRG